MNTLTKSALDIFEKQDYSYLLCYTKALKNIFKDYRCRDISEYVGKECCFYQFEEKSRLIYTRRTRDYPDELEGDFGFMVPTYQCGGLQQSLENIQRKLAEGILSLALVDMFYIPYDQFYRNMHRAHYIVITEVSFDKQTVFVKDGMYNLCKELCFADLEQAMGEWKDDIAKFQFTDFIVPSKLIELSKEHFIIQMWKNLKSMLEPDMVIDDTAGIKGICNIAENIESIIVKFSQGRMVDMINTLTHVAEQLELHAHYIVNMARKFDLNGFLPLAEDMFLITQNWAVGRNMILKASVKNNQQFMNRCKERFQTIAALEQDYLRKLETVLSHFNR